MIVLSQILTFTVGFIIVVSTLSSALNTFVVPRSVNTWLTRVVFFFVWIIFKPWISLLSTYEARDRVMALYAPLSILILPLVWFTCVLIGYMGMFWALGVQPWSEAFFVSGSSLLTLGFAPVTTLLTRALAFTEATIGLGLMALVIAYLPTMYSAFARRETTVALLEVRAGAPPSPLQLIARAHRINTLDNLTELWINWELWFTDIEESHTTFGPLALFRSPQSNRSWITAAGVILDAAALMESTIDVAPDPRAALCIRAGYVALRQIADFFGIPHRTEITADDTISITRQEFDQACQELREQSIPLKADLDLAWQNYHGWRVNYDDVLVALANLTMAPSVMWVSDEPRRGPVKTNRFITIRY